MLDQPLIVSISHARAAGICVTGSRAWFRSQGLDFRDFLRNGIDAEVLRATGDPIVARAVAEAEREKEQQNGG